VTLLDRAEFVFAELRGIFGREFTLEHGETPSQYWRDAIAQLTSQEIDRGLRALAARGGGPPNASEFVNICRRGRRDRYAPSGPVATPASSSVTAEATLARIRTRLGSNHERRS
jgi:hypothetical protein